jgi:hypothetical protein
VRDDNIVPLRKSREGKEQKSEGRNRKTSIIMPSTPKRPHLTACVLRMAYVQGIR